MYSEFMPEWQAHVRPARLLVLRTEDYFEQPLKAVKKVWRLLGLRAPTDAERQRAEIARAQDELSRVHDEHGDPPAQPLAKVRHFYKPFTENLAILLEDRAFLWEN